MYFMYCNVFEFTMHWASCSGGTCVGLMYKFLSALLRLMQHLTLNAVTHVGSVQWPDVLPSTPGVMHVYSQHYTCITLGVMQG